MVGREMAANECGATAQDGAVVLSVQDLTLDTLGPHGWRRMLHGVSFELKRGEILGVGGLLGSGRTEILESIFGVARGWRAGSIAIDGAARRHPLSLRRLPSRRRARQRGPQGTRPASGRLDLRQCRAALDRRAVAIWPACVRPRARTRRRHGQATVGSLHRHRPGSRRAVWRQPAKGRDRQMAGDRTAHPAARRADPRHRYRRQAGDLPADLRSRRAGARHHRRHLGNARTPAVVRPHPRHVRRTADRHPRTRERDAGDGDAPCGTGMANWSQEAAS